MTISISGGGLPFYDGNPDGEVEAPLGQRLVDKGTGIIYQQVIAPNGTQWVATGGNDWPTPTFGAREPFGEFVKIWVRPTGSDIYGDGSRDNPYRTLVRGVRDIPLNIRPGYRYVVDITGLSERLPTNYELPGWKSGFITDEVTGSGESAKLYSAGDFIHQYAVAIYAEPQLVSTISEADATISASDIQSQVALTGSGLFLLKLNTARASWGNNALKGKFLFGSTQLEHTVIGESTTGSLLLISHSGMTGTLYIKEPSAFLTSSTTVNPNVKGGFAARSCDSLALVGIDFYTPTAGVTFALELGGQGNYSLNFCKVQSGLLHANSAGGVNNRYQRSHFTGRMRIGGNVQLQAIYGTGLTAFNFVGGGQYSWRRMLIESSSAGAAVFNIFPGAGNTQPGAVTNFLIQHSIIRGITGDGFKFSGVRGRMENVDIYGCTRDAIRCESGSGLLELREVRTAFGSAFGYAGSVNAGYGIRVFDGMAVKVDETVAQNATSQGQQVRGTLGHIRVGNRPARTFDDFVSGTTGPALFEIDSHTDTTTGLTSGSLSRVYQA
jgi:hypothetical protein